MLPMTDASGARTVLRDITSAMRGEGIEIDANIFCYDPVPTDQDQPANVESEDSEYGERDLKGKIVGKKIAPSHELIDTALSRSPTAAISTEKKNSICAQFELYSRINAEHDFIRQSPNPDHLEYFAPSFPAWKRWIDVVGSVCGIVIAIPIVIIAGLAIKMTSRGPVFFANSELANTGVPSPCTNCGPWC